MNASRKKIGIVTPCYNEEAGIEECYYAVRKVMAGELAGYDYEHLFIDNCSTDGTLKILKKIAGADKHVKIIVNARNFGHTRSPHHAMMEVDGDAVTCVLADLQTPPGLLPELVKHWQDGSKIVVGVRKSMHEGLLLRLARGAYYKIITRLSDVAQIRNFIGYGLYDRSVIEIIRSLDEPDPYFRGLVAEIGFEKKIVEYDQPLRKHGRSRHSFLVLFDLALLGLTSHSRVPLKLMVLFGFLASAFSFIAGMAYLVMKILFWNSFPMGIVPLLIATFFLSSIQLFALGLIGEYLGHVLRYARRFPLVIEKERINFD